MDMLSPFLMISRLTLFIPLKADIACIATSGFDIASPFILNKVSPFINPRLWYSPPFITSLIVKPSCFPIVPDVLFLQEHHQLEANLKKLNFNDNYFYIATGALPNEYLRGRPSGGCAILLNNKFQSTVDKNFWSIIVYVVFLS